MTRHRTYTPQTTQPSGRRIHTNDAVVSILNQIGRLTLRERYDLLFIFLAWMREIDP